MYIKCCLLIWEQPFVAQVTPSVQALQNMGNRVDQELRDLLVYFGEQNTEGTDAMKPEDFFGLILSFSTAIQVRALWFLWFVLTRLFRKRRWTCILLDRKRTRSLHWLRQIQIWIKRTFCKFPACQLMHLTRRRCHRKAAPRGRRRCGQATSMRQSGVCTMHDVAIGLGQSVRYSWMEVRGRVVCSTSVVACISYDFSHL